ncbi:hypothetical protein LTR56_014657 [Elasticomyces elasticus]|nr:hypothetical protein LTR56_014657 [Elasticomyces elasticus]KAK3645334.1 hypothetical protein LTR22_014799 [Elasticomyces elasticus]KAK4919825.1 hypothetical protein LTR49_012572 [Elasticomyces elasticus]KAK5750105.1 hypothetical protein LTS12_019831 [Elasticomyces elasticus]
MAGFIVFPLAFVSVLFGYATYQEYHHDKRSQDIEKGGDALMWYTNGTHVPGLRVSVERDSEDDVAWFSADATQGREAVEWTKGVWTNVPVVDPDGVMRGNFSVRLPGDKEATAGEWISVDRSVEPTEEEKTQCQNAFEAVMQEESSSGRPQITLDQLLERTASGCNGQH